ncbi:MAG: DeoR/GlpR family DNA-binding transcription regulator [Candidatus Pacebacteria bacterium]|nr:DeoR/GlpR family DNA-binding transcription regulator [Candidatus Paceibacterota bacterium]
MIKPRTSTRAQDILELLTARDEVSVAELADRFQVTPMTIRRDLEALAAEGRITRTHGGAVLTAPSVVAFAFQERRQARLAEKQAIAREATRHIPPGTAMILDTGTTTLEVAKAIKGIPDLKVLTSSLAIASALLAHDQLELVLLGGTVNRGSPDLSGPLTEENLASFRADVAVIGADAVDQKGLYTRCQNIAGVSRAMIASAGKTVLVADSSKFGTTSFVQFADWKDIDIVVVDTGLAPTHQRWLKKLAGKLLFAQKI